MLFTDVTRLANCITSFVWLMISVFRFRDNVQRNISRCVQVNKYRDCCIYYSYIGGGRELKTRNLD